MVLPKISRDSVINRIEPWKTQDPTCEAMEKSPRPCWWDLMRVAGAHGVTESESSVTDVRMRDLGLSLELSAALYYASYFCFRKQTFHAHASSVTSLKTMLPRFYYRFGFQPDTSNPPKFSNKHRNDRKRKSQVF
jgi:hypothetical protein